MADNYQQLTIDLTKAGVTVKVTSMYARCSSLERLELWDELEHISGNNLHPWVVGGDFNVILNKDEKLWGVAFFY